MLPAADLSEILTNLSVLNLQPNIAAAVLGAVFAPLLRSSEVPQAGLQPGGKPSRRPRRSKPRRTVRRGRKPGRALLAVQTAGEPTDGPRQRAARALAANPGVSLTRVAKLAGVGRSTVVNARRDLDAAARKSAQPAAEPAAPAERRERAQRFLQEQLGRGPRQVSDVEEAAAKAHVDPQTLEQARADLGIVTSRGNAGGVQAVQWSLPLPVR